MRPRRAGGRLATSPGTADQAMLAGEPVFTTDSYVVQPDLFPRRRYRQAGRVRHGERPGHARRAAAVPQRRLHPRGGLAAGRPGARRRLDGGHGREAGVRIVTGDTKVVERGSADKLFINTAGIGLVPPGVHISAASGAPGRCRAPQRRRGRPRPGHHDPARGAALRERSAQRLRAAQRPGAADVCDACPDIHVLRDPTRGGLATTLNELAAAIACGHRDRRGGGARARSGARRRASCWGSTRSMSPTRAS